MSEVVIFISRLLAIYRLRSYSFAMWQLRSRKGQPIEAALPLPVASAVTGPAPACCFVYASGVALMAELPGSLSSIVSFDLHKWGEQYDLSIAPSAASKNL